jgi:hypothetical protein
MKRLSPHTSIKSRRIVHNRKKNSHYPTRYTRSNDFELKGYTLIDIEKAKMRAFVAKNLWELKMWEQIERGEI